MEKSSMTDYIYMIFKWIIRFVITNIMWLLMNIPVLFIVISMFLSEEMDHLLILLPILLILLPFFFFPATTAMFASTRCWLIHQESYSLVKSYLKYYKENYKSSLYGGFILTGVWLIWGIGYYLFHQQSAVVHILLIVIGLFVYVASINFFSIGVHFHMSVREIIKNACLLTFGNPLLFYGVLLSSLLIIYMSLKNISFSIPFLFGSLIAFVSFSLFYKLIVKNSKIQV